MAYQPGRVTENLSNINESDHQPRHTKKDLKVHYDSNVNLTTNVNNRASTSTTYDFTLNSCWKEIKKWYNRNRKRSIVIIISLFVIAVIALCVGLFFAGMYQLPSPAFATLDGQTETASSGDGIHSLTANLFFDHLGKETNVCKLDKPESCSIKICSFPGTIIGVWMNGSSEIQTNGEKIKMLQNFKGGLKISANLYHSPEDKYGWIAYVNGKPWKSCAFYRMHDRTTTKSKFCQHAGSSQRYLVNNITMVLTMVMIDDPEIVLKNGDEITFALVSNKTVLVGNPSMVFEGM